MFVAIAVKGKEFLYRANTRLSVPKSSANKIREILNKTGYHLRDGEIWHVYDTEFGDEMAGSARMRKGNVRINWEVPIW